MTTYWWLNVILLLFSVTKLISTRFFVGASGNKGLMQRYRISLYLSNNVACAASSLGALPDTAFLKNNLVGIYDNEIVVKRDSLFILFNKTDQHEILCGRIR
jgi:hypothetical protein